MTAVKQEFIHKVDKAKIPTCNILGVDIAAVDMVWLLDYLNDNIHALSGDYKAPIVSKNLESDKYENEKVKAAAEQFKSAEEGTAVSDIFAAAGEGTTVKDQNGEDKDISQYKTCGSLVEVAMKLGDEYFTNAECQFEGTVQMDLEQVDYKALLKSAGIDENTSDEDLLNVEEFEAPDYVLAQLNAVSGEASVSTGLKFGFEKVEGSDRPVLVIKGTFNGLGPVALASKAE